MSLKFYRKAKTALQHFIEKIKQHYSALNLDPERGGGGGRDSEGNPTKAQRVACAMQVPRRSDEKETELGMETLKLKSGEKIKVLNGACMA